MQGSRGRGLAAADSMRHVKTQGLGYKAEGLGPGV